MEKEAKTPKAEKEPKATVPKLSLASLALAFQAMVEANLLMEQRIESLEKEVKELKVSGGKNRGPKSTRDMTEDDARRVVFGDLKKASIKKAAEVLGLSYGQVYSARGGYTFKGLTEVAPVEGKN